MCDYSCTYDATVEHPAIRTFKLRRGRVTQSQASALEKNPVASVTDFDVAAVMPGTVLEIGFGFGEATAELARRHPTIPVIATDVHTPGIGRLVGEIAATGMQNLAVLEGDARVLLERLDDAALGGIRVFFPDPWQKARHFKRRLIQDDFLNAAARVVTPGGFLHIATDWDDYAHWSRERLVRSAHWGLVERHDLADPASRPVTRFQQRAIIAGRTITDLVAVRA